VKLFGLSSPGKFDFFFYNRRLGMKKARLLNGDYLESLMRTQPPLT